MLSIALLDDPVCQTGVDFRNLSKFREVVTVVVKLSDRQKTAAIVATVSIISSRLRIIDR